MIDNKSHTTDAPQETPVVVVVDANSSVESPHVRGDFVDTFADKLVQEQTEGQCCHTRVVPYQE